MGILGAACTTILTKQKKLLNKSEWDKIRTDWVSLPAENYFNLRGGTLAFCQQYGCSRDLQTAIYHIDQLIVESRRKTKGVKE